MLQNFKIVEVNITIDFYGLQMHQFRVWIQKNAIKNFVDKYISCDKNKLAPNVHETQTHHHKKTCRKKNQAICQSNFPYPPMEKTQILESFPMESLTPSKRVHLGEINKRIFEELNKIDLQTTFMSFTTLLKLFFIDKKTYINALQVKNLKPANFFTNIM